MFTAKEFQTIQLERVKDFRLSFTEPLTHEIENELGKALERLRNAESLALCSRRFLINIPCSLLRPPSKQYHTFPEATLRDEFSARGFTVCSITQHGYYWVVMLEF